MNKILILLAAAILIIGGIFYLHTHSASQENQPAASSDYKNATYVIGGTEVTLTNGVSEVEAAPGSASKITTTYFGNELTKDLNGDGRPDVVFILTQNTGGSGTFFYAVAALNTETKYVGSEGYLLGDRIAPQTTESGTGNTVVVNYADRAPGEPFTTEPTVGKSVRLVLDQSTMQFTEVPENNIEVQI